MTPDRSEPGDNRAMSAIYVRVIVLEAAIIAVLWLFGRAFR
jgi:hypothetical protein